MKRESIGKETMKVSIFGLGYVGCVTAACLTHDGHEVVGVDVVPAKVDRLGSGLPTVIGPDDGPTRQRNRHDLGQ